MWVWVAASALGGGLLGGLVSWLILRSRYRADITSVWVEAEGEGDVVFRSFNEPALKEVSSRLGEGKRDYKLMSMTLEV